MSILYPDHISLHLLQERFYRDVALVATDKIFTAVDEIAIPQLLGPGGQKSHISLTF